MNRRRNSLSATTTLLFTAVSLWAQTNTLVVLPENETRFGDVSLDLFYPVNNIQQVYAATEFSAAAADVLTITDIAFRVDETQEAMDITFPRVIFRMNVFPGTMDEIVQKQNAVVPPVITVFDAESIRLVGRSRHLDAFDLRFRLNPPFRYDRRAGHLVLFVAHSSAPGNTRSVDMEYVTDGNGNPSIDRGALVRAPNFVGDVPVRPYVIATKFYYIYMSAVITAITVHEKVLIITFSVVGEPSSIELEAAQRVEGPYERVSSADIAREEQGPHNATVPIPLADQFFRILLR